MLPLLLAAGVIAHLPTTLEGRMSLLEARQMLEAQQIWALRAELPPDAVRALSDLQLHVQHDQEQEDKVHELTQTVQLLEQRLAALELLLQDKSLTESVRIPVAPMQVKPLVVPAAPAKAKPAAKKKKKAAPKRRARVAEAP
jgi:hypothetical protein